MANKEATVAELAENFRDSNAVLLTEYRGLTVAQLKQLRKNIGEHANYAVVKNTLTKIAANQAGISSFDEELAGAVKASLFGAAYMFNAPLAQAARAVDALRQKQESGS